MRKRAGQRCSAINCKNNRLTNRDMSFFRFPKDKERSKRWVLNSRRQDLLDKSAEHLFRSNVLCVNHFEMSQFTSTKKSVWNDKKQYQHYSMFPTHLRKYNQSENHLCHGSQYLWKTSIWQIMTKINQRNPMVKHELANLKLRRWKRKIDA